MFKNNGNIYSVEKASKGKDIKVKSYRGGGMDMGNKGNQKQSASMASTKVSTSPFSSGNQGATKTNKTMSRSTTPKSTTSKSTTSKSSKNQFNINNRDVPFVKPFGYKTQIAAGLLGIGPIVTAANFGAKNQYKSRQKFATKEGLARDYYRMGKGPLKPNSPTGKEYLKDAGFGNKKNPINTSGRGDDNSIIPIPTLNATKTKKSVDPNLVKPKENFFNFQAYNVGGLSGGVRYGPPPKRGPNPNVPPIKMKHGSKKEIKAGYHKMPDGSIMKNSAHKGSK